MPAFDVPAAGSAPSNSSSNAAQVLGADAGRAQAAPREAFSADSVRRIAHDLNNALATVSGYAQLLEGQPDWPPHLSRQLQTLAHDAARATALAGELLLLTQPAEQPAAGAPTAAPLASANGSACTSTSGASNGVLPVSSLNHAGLASTGAAGAEILVVDDEEPVLTLISEILTMDGYSVTPAFNGAEALAWTQVRDFALIISDVRMPAVGGPAFYEILQNERPDLLRRVLFVTGDTVSLSTRHFLAGTQRPVLAKPFDPDRLLDMVRVCLAS